MAEVVAVAAGATVVTLMLAVPVLRAPAERVFGMEIVGRHHDPFTAMEQFRRPVGVSVYSQPVTDVTGAMLARISGEVAAYNWLVLLSFPLAAVAAYLLARYLTLSPLGATSAAMAYAFSPFHLAHAAYHAHIAQTQWMPLYLLALWWCLDVASPVAVGALTAATLAVTLSNFYGGMIAAVLTPPAVAAYWLATRREHARPMRRLGVTVGALILVAAAGIAYGSHAARAVFVNRAAYAFPRADLFLYSAKWWSYLVPPVEHPVLGAAARRVWNSVGVREGLLEQQVYLGWGIVLLGSIAVARWFVRDRRLAPLTRVPVLVIVGVAALVCSLSPDWTIWFSFVRPSALLYHVVPMFRSYARFGVVVQLMASLLAGIGVDYLRRAATRRAQIACVVLLALAAGEYAVAPASLWRDVLPTTAHRWLTRQPDLVRALDCTPFSQESESIVWLTGQRVTLGGSNSDCTEPNLSQKLAATGYTHLLVRRDTVDGQWLVARPALDGLRVVASLTDGVVLAVTARAPAVYTAAMTGFFPREHDAERVWQWMATDAAWTTVNATARPIIVTLGLEVSAFHHARRLELRLDGRQVQTLVVEPSRRTSQLGPFTLTPGAHELAFHAAEGPTVAGDVIHNGDQRALSFALGTWSWTVQGEQP